MSGQRERRSDGMRQRARKEQRDGARRAEMDDASDGKGNELKKVKWNVYYNKKKTEKLE